MTTVRAGTAQELDALGPLWRRFYDDQRAGGMRLAVPDSGFQDWVESLRPALGRFACLIVAEQGGAIVGFVAGRTRAAPRYLGGTASGWISEVWVEPAHRRRGLAEAMVREAVAWFRGQGLSRIELQLLVRNEAARRLYARMGFADEVVQMVLDAGGQSGGASSAT